MSNVSLHEHVFNAGDTFCEFAGCFEKNPSMEEFQLTWRYTNSGQQFGRIMQLVVPQVLAKFEEKNSEYKENAQTLGVRGQFADIWRKIGKLKTALWDGEPERLTSETTQEVLWDLIGHCLLTLDMLPEEYK